MKYLTIAIVFAGMLSTASAFAQSTSSVDPQPTNGATASASNTTTAASPAGKWVPPYGQPVAGETRAQVYQELVHAEQDGQLQYLNSTVYKGS